MFLGFFNCFYLILPVATHIYFGTAGGGIKSYSLATSTVSTVVDSTEDLEAIAYDSTMNKIYFCRWDPGQIYRANMDGSEIEILSSNVDCELHFITMNSVRFCIISGVSEMSLSIFSCEIVRHSL